MMISDYAEVSGRCSDKLSSQDPHQLGKCIGALKACIRPGDEQQRMRAYQGRLSAGRRQWINSQPLAPGSTVSINP